jgi:hypothetical protein
MGVVQEAKDFNNLIGGEQKFVYWAFTLEANGLQNSYMTTLFGNFSAKSLFNGENFVPNINRNPNPPQAN